MDSHACICGGEMIIGSIDFTGFGQPLLFFWHCVGSEPHRVGCGYWIPCDCGGETGADNA